MGDSTADEDMIIMGPGLNPGSIRTTTASPAAEPASPAGEPKEVDLSSEHPADLQITREDHHHVTPSDAAGQGQQLRETDLSGELSTAVSGVQVVREPPHKRQQRRHDAGIGMPYESVRGAFDSLIRESDLQAHDASQAARRWRWVYYVLGLPLAVLTGLAGAAGLASEAFRVWAGVLALVSATLVAVSAFLDSERRRQQSAALAAEWKSLCEEARLSKLTFKEAGWVDQKSAIARLETLNKKKARLLRGEVRIDTESEASPHQDDAPQGSAPRLAKP